MVFGLVFVILVVALGGGVKTALRVEKRRQSKPSYVLTVVAATTKVATAWGGGGGGVLPHG